MRFIELVGKVLEYNETLCRLKKGDEYFKSKVEYDIEKNKFLPEYKKLAKRLEKQCKELEEFGLKFSFCESIDGIEIPELLKREEIERYLDKVKLKEKEN